MNKISINKCVGGAWDLTTKNWIMCIIVLVTSIVVSAISSLTAPTVDYNTSGMTFEELINMYAEIISNSFGVFTLVAYIVQYIIYAGLYKMSLNAYNGQKADTSAYKMPLATYVKFIAACIAYCILVWVGLICCIIPGIIIGVRLMFTPFILLDEPETELTEAFKKSWVMTSGNFWSLFGLLIVALLINVVGFVCCCIGVIFTAVMAVFMMVIAYYQLKDNVNDFGQPVTEI